MRAITVIGTNVVIDCETVEEAVAYMDRLAATLAPLDVLVAEEAVYAALLYINQRTPRPRAARALMDALRQDGYEVRRVTLAATPAPLDGLPGLIAIHRAWHENPRYDIALDTPCPLAPLDEFECPGCGGRWRYQTRPDGSKAVEHLATPAPLDALCGAVLTCALPILHDGDHERADGIRWTWPAAPAPPVTLSHGQGSGNDTVILRNSLTIHATPAPLDVREWAKAVVRSVPPVHIENTDAVPTFKRRPDQCIDRAAVLLALEHATPAPLDVPVRGALARAWKRRAKMYRGLWSRQLREFHDWRTALRAAGISEMVDMNPDAIRLTVTVPREKRINEMVEERIAAFAAATPAPLPDVRGEVLPIKVRPAVDLAVTPAPLDVLVAAILTLPTLDLSTGVYVDLEDVLFLVRDGDEAKL